MLCTACMQHKTYLAKVFSCPLWEMWKFSTTQDYGCTDRSCIVYVALFLRITLRIVPSVECYQ